MSALHWFGGGGAPPKTYIEDVFSACPYTGNGSTQTITNGIDLTGKGGMVWVKSRSAASTPHQIHDTVRGALHALYSNQTNGQVTDSSIESAVTSFNSNGFTAKGTSDWWNQSGVNFSSWTFRKAAKFFDCGTYTGTGAAQTIAHALGQTVGWLFIKRTSGTGNWAVFARTGGSAGSTTYAYFNSSAGLNLTAAASASSVGAEALGYITSTGFKPNDLSGSSAAGNADNINESGATYVYYAFAHDTSTDGLIQCGSYTGTGAAGNAVTLGWEPQLVLIKEASGTNAASGNWVIQDNMRGMSATAGTCGYLSANDSGSEGGGNNGVKITATGFAQFGGGATLNESGGTYIYLAIRRGPMKPPTSGTQVYQAIARTGTGAAASVTGVGFPPDLTFSQQRTAVQGSWWYDRLRGAKQYLSPSSTSAEGANATGVTSFDMDGFTVGSEGSVNGSGISMIHHFFRRYPGVFDQVCYTGTGVAHSESHNLGVVPELMLVKNRSSVFNWEVYYGDTTSGNRLNLNTTSVGAHTSVTFNDTAPTSANFTVGTSGSTNQSGSSHVAYLFATLPGISKVFSTTKVAGVDKNVDCGFAAGARFILMKSTGTGGWYLWDSVRGIVAGNDPYLLLNSTAAEVTTTDYIDPYAAGFTIVDGGLPNGDYIGVAIS